MRLHTHLSIVVLHFTVAQVHCFRSSGSWQRTTLLGMTGSFLPDIPVPNLPNPLKRLTLGSDPLADTVDIGFTPSPEGVVAQAKKVLSSDLGLRDPTILDDDRFVWIGPSVEKPLDKTDYLAAGRFFDLRNAFPDLNYRAHDFRVDTFDPATVRFTCRTTGTMRGELRLRDTTLAPTGNTMRCPPEAVSISFDMSTGKVIKLCSGFCLDRFVGNTDGTTGVVAAAIIGGNPVSDWEVYPPATVISRFFGRPAKQIPEATTFLAPFPESVMVQLAKGIILSDLGLQDPSLLGEDFTFCTLTIGPIRKTDFLEKYAEQQFKDVTPNFSNFRVDPYDPNRVWVDIQPVAPGYQGAPQALSFSFDQDGFCTRITADAVMDPSIGNGGGLGGPDGLRFARGEGANILTTRPLGRTFEKWRNTLLDPLFGSSAVPEPTTGISTDKLQPSSSLGSVQQLKRDPPLKENKPSPPSSARVEEPKVTIKSESPLEKLASLPLGSINILQQQMKAFQGSNQKPNVVASQVTDKEPIPKKNDSQKENKPSPLQQLGSSLGSIKVRQVKTKEQAQAERNQAIAQRSTKSLTRIASKANPNKERESIQQKLAREREAKTTARLAAEEARKLALEKAAKERLEATRMAREQAAKEKIAATKAKASAEANLKTSSKSKTTTLPLQAQRIAQRKAEADSLAQQKKQEEVALGALAKVASKATISLFGFGRTVDDEVEVTKSANVGKAPRGVPTLKRWRRNLDGSVSGLVSGSRVFDDGERITTSPIAKGDISSGQIVTTGSGSRYYLE